MEYRAQRAAGKRQLAAKDKGQNLRGQSLRGQNLRTSEVRTSEVRGQTIQVPSSNFQVPGLQIRMNGSYDFNGFNDWNDFNRRQMTDGNFGLRI